MKLKNSLQMATAAIAATALTLSSTQAQEAKEAEKPKAKPAVKTEKAAKGSIEKQIEGSWGMDKDALIAMVKQQMGGGEVPAEAMAGIESMAAAMMLEIKDGKSTMHNPFGKPEVGTYKFIKTDKATGAFTISITSGGGEAKEASGKIKGDKMTMIQDGQEVTMKRLSADEIAKRKAGKKDK